MLPDPVDDSQAPQFEDLRQLPFLDAVLEVVCAATGLGFAAVVRMTEDRWIASGVRDAIRFGVRYGDVLPVTSTLCHEVRQTGKPILIEDVSTDPKYSTHPVPAMHGFESYVSFPIRQKDGVFFGTVCAIGFQPVRLNVPLVDRLFTTLTALLAVYIDGSAATPTERIAWVMDAVAALRAIRQELAAGETANHHQTRQVITRLDELLQKLAPLGALMA